MLSTVFKARRSDDWNLGRTQLTKKCEEYGAFKNLNGYYKREDLDLIVSGATSKIDELVRKIKL